LELTSGRKNQKNQVELLAVGALDPSLTGKLAPGTSGAGIGETFGCDEGIVGIEELIAYLHT